MLLGNHQQMSLVKGHYIHEGNDTVILVDLFTGDLTGYNLAKYAIIPLAHG
jgi:hypothetical protein